MADKPTEVVLLSENIGLPPGASGEDIVKRVYELQEQSKRFEQMQSESDRLLAKAEDGEKAKAELAKVEARLFIERAVTNQWIDKSQADFYAEMYAKEPTAVKKHIEDQKFRSFLTRAQALSANDIEKSKVGVEAEIEGRVASEMAKDGKLTKSEAQTKVFTENPKLYDAYRAIQVGAKGGAN